jgi:hypothetical protein
LRHCPERVALYSWWSPSRNDHFATTNAAWAGQPGDIRPPDYEFVRREGSVCSPSVPQPPGTVTIYTWWSPSRSDHFATSNPAWAGQLGDRRPPDYEFVGREGYIYSPDVPPPPGTAPLYSWWSPSRGDNVATSNAAWAGKLGDIKTPDYEFVRLEGYVLP